MKGMDGITQKEILHTPAKDDRIADLRHPH